MLFLFCSFVYKLLTYKSITSSYSKYTFNRRILLFTAAVISYNIFSFHIELFYFSFLPVSFVPYNRTTSVLSETKQLIFYTSEKPS